MLVAAAVCPHPPLLVPEVMGVAGERGSDIGDVLAACDAAVAGLAAAEPGLIVVVGGAAASAVYDGPAARRAAWQVLAGAADGERLRGRLLCATARYEVSYLVASWDRRS